MLLVYRKRRAKAAKAPTPHEQIQRITQQRGMQGDLENLMVEIEQLSKRLSAQLDAKSLELERLVNDADKRLTQLQEAIQHPGFSHSAPTNQPQDAQTLPNTDDPLVQSVYRLADQGLGPAEIARQLNEHIGKIELIMALRKP